MFERKIIKQKAKKRKINAYTKSNSWRWARVSVRGGLSCPDVRESFAGVASKLLSLDDFSEEGNLLGILNSSIMRGEVRCLWSSCLRA